jgi:predicted hotdog family 3-hydroxylacyl-ACP dehydratase
MCLLDEVMDWNAERIVCRTATHRAPDNPLRAHGRLGVACGIEYAAQAMALHGALAGGAVPQVGLLAGIRAVHFSVVRLDDIDSDLICEVTRLAGDAFTALYEFALRDGRRTLASGRASVVLDAGDRLKL